MKDGYFAHVINPMTIIGLFVGVVEIICGGALPAVPNDLKFVIVWFLVLFPVGSILLFYFVLIRHPQNLYGPQDFKDDHAFLSSIRREGNTLTEKISLEQESLRTELVIESGQQIAALAKESTSEVKIWLDYYLEKDYDKAIALLENELLQENTLETKRVALRAIIGDIKVNKDFQLGVTYFEKLIGQYPEEQLYYTWLANEYLKRDLPEKCLNIVETGLLKAKEKTRLIETKATCLDATNRGNEAVTLLETSIENSPTEQGLYTTLIDILSRTNPGEVEKWYRKGLIALAEDEKLVSKYAAFLFEKGRNEEALYRYSTLNRLFPTNTDYLVLLANVYLTLDLNDKAHESYEKAKSRITEPESWVFANIGNLYTNRGFYTRAISYFNEALAINPNDDYTHKRLAVALELQTIENKKAEELEKKGQQTFLQGDTTKHVSSSE